MLLWLDGFDNYGTTVGSAPSPTGVVQRKYPINGGLTNARIRTGRLGGYALDCAYDTSYIGRGSLTTVDTVVAGWAINFNSLIYAGYTFFYLLDGATAGINLRHTGAGEIQIYRGSTLLGTSSGAGIGSGIWKYFELKVKCHDTAGTYELRVGGVNVCSASGVNTKAGTHNYHDGFQHRGIDANQPKIDDFYFLDTSGAMNNDFLGNMRVVTIRPNAVGDSSDFTPSAGSNYECVDEEIADDGTTYVVDDTTDQKDLYNYGSVTFGTIKGIMVNTDCRETDALNYDLVTVCKSGVTESDDAGQSVGSIDFVTKHRVLETDPNTSAAWTATNLNAAQFGIKVG